MKQTDPNHPHHRCVSLFEQLSEYIDKELDPPTCDEIEQHIKDCKPCQVCLCTLQQTVAMCRKLERRQVPEVFSAKLKDIIGDLVNDRHD
jgi:anti-sigma factor RsiW